MRNNKIFNVVNLINKRYNTDLEYSDEVIKDLKIVVSEVYGSNYISLDDLKTVIRLMANYIE